MIRIKEYFQENPLKYFSIGLILLIVIAVVWLVIKANSSKEHKINLNGEYQLQEATKGVTFEDLYNEESSGNYFFGNLEEEPPIQKNNDKDYTSYILDSIKEANQLSNITKTKSYTNTQPNQTTKINTYTKEAITKNSDSKTNTHDITMQQELDLYRQLRERKERQTSLNSDKNTAIVPSIKVRASIHNDQYIFPSDRVTLMLAETFTYQGNTFPRNTLIYAIASFSENRVLLNISNIQHVSISLQAVDLQDGQVGMYVPQVGEFRSKYNAALETETINNASQEIQTISNSGTMGRVISSIGNLFRSKKLKDRDRIFLINDQQVFLTNMSP